MASSNRTNAVVTSTPLWLILTFVFLNSMGSGVITTGFVFLAQTYNFSPRMGYVMGLAQGITYIVGALFVGPCLARLGRESGRIKSRTVLVLLMLMLTGLCLLPLLIRAFNPASAALVTWPFWMLVLGYSMLTGVLWPIAESYMSGGRSGQSLRSAMGTFNVVWSSSLVVAYWSMGPLIGSNTLETIAGVGAVHLACLGLLIFFTPEPAVHLSEAHAVAPESYRRLLGVIRIQLPTSYMVYSALTPFLPIACASLNIPKHWATPLAATWLTTRVLTFAVLQRWHGWHGRWATAWVGSLVLMVGFGLAVLSTSIARLPGSGTTVGIAALILGLGFFGIGMGVIYCAALYYAMAVGNSQVDAGGKHEALIGLGYGAGPVCALMALSMADAGWLAEGRALWPITGGHFEVVMLILVAVAAGGLVAWSLIRASGHSDKRTPTGRNSGESGG